MDDQPQLTADDFHRFFQGNGEAVKLIGLLYQVFHTWDDLIDRDRAVTDQAVNNAFWDLLCELPRNPFFLLWRDELVPAIRSAVMDWQSSVSLERAGDLDSVGYAYGLRASLATVVIQIAYLIGDKEWADQVAQEVRQVVIQTEGFEAYCENLDAERKARMVVVREKKA